MHLFDFWLVFHWKPAMRYLLALNCAQIQAFRLSFRGTAYYSFAVALHPRGELFITFTTITSFSTLVGLPASVLGYELSERIGWRNAIRL